ncbi:GNAT family N-acetyltransferase [Vibrio sinensis]|uniref:GNAT family N-acetyltransferase n=1 Tax=Vibrio sinensis TaxID=2302434 RepID=A0A3A6QDZ2_9VIBR|nr:GNAT family N-acetyltransferase [Vibrio sinensis]RJX70151.1 GNAT family N-acetyltransferase [Vibrio sinensis]
MNIEILPISAQFDAQICTIIKTVGAEYGAVGEGFGPSDAEVLAMSQHYTKEQCSLYLVAFIDGEIVGGCGVAPFNGSQQVCELKKLFLLPKSRGKGIGKTLSTQCLTFAQQQGFQQCYLDTLNTMQSAISLYQKLGFEHLSAPLAGTEHNGCDVWMLMSLNDI